MLVEKGASWGGGRSSSVNRAMHRSRGKPSAGRERGGLALLPLGPRSPHRPRGSAVVPFLLARAGVERLSGVARGAGAGLSLAGPWPHVAPRAPRRSGPDVHYPHARR